MSIYRELLLPIAGYFIGCMVCRTVGNNTLSHEDFTSFCNRIVLFSVIVILRYSTITLLRQYIIIIYDYNRYLLNLSPVLLHKQMLKFLGYSAR